jgi:chromosome segregation ATPase
VTSQREELRSLRQDLTKFESALKDAHAARQALEEEVRRLKGVEGELQEKLAERERESKHIAAQVKQLEEEVEAAKHVEGEMRAELHASHALMKRVEEQEEELVGRRVQELELLASLKDLQAKVLIG